MKIKYLQLDTVNSTNDYLKQLTLNELVANKSFVFANEQTKGKGQLGNTWISAYGENILTSCFLSFSNLLISKQVTLTMLTCLGIHQFLLEILGVDKDVKIKWPNDIYVNNKKICGILIENSFVGHHIESSIIGIGLNCNQRNFDLPNVTSIALILNEKLDLNTLKQKFIETLLPYFDQMLATPNYSDLKIKYMSKLMGVNEMFLYEDNISDSILCGVITDIDELGRVVIKNVTTGQVMVYNNKEISLIINL
ncbi:MAG: biotin--[acetyl-CoA-carboxylase] ligase [Bacteroidota bacterium]|nr:biotin--[acetyl-CoA-carboxylase] ligase [Bacteroidota bacterium]